MVVNVFDAQFEEQFWDRRDVREWDEFLICDKEGIKIFQPKKALPTPGVSELLVDNNYYKLVFLNTKN